MIRTSPKKAQLPFDDPWEDLVISVLSVNQYTLERTYLCIDGLRKVGVFDPLNLMGWEPADIADRLKVSGCDRGEFMTKLFALRLAHLGELVRQQGVETSTRIISRKDRKAIEQ